MFNFATDNQTSSSSEAMNKKSNGTLDGSINNGNSNEGNNKKKGITKKPNLYLSGIVALGAEILAIIVVYPLMRHASR